MANANVIDREHVRMGERSDRSRLMLEPKQTIGIGAECDRKDFDGDIATEAWVTRPIDLTHAACAERREDFVGAEARPGGEGQAVGLYERAARTVESDLALHPCASTSLLLGLEARLIGVEGFVGSGRFTPPCRRTGRSNLARNAVAVP